MSTFLTQGGGLYSNNSKKTNNLQVPKVDDQAIQSAVLYAPFVKPQDKLKPNVSELSFSDFQPKRFALNYDPPMIILEYLVPSTGKLYHHKMKLRQLKAETPTQEVIDYLRKRHPLYFIANKISEEQINDLVNRLKFKLKQMSGMMGGGLSKETPASKKENQTSQLSTQMNTRPQSAT